MRIWAVHFKKYEEEYSGSNKGTYVEKKVESGPNKKIKVNKERGLLVIEPDMLKYIDYGEGYDKIIYMGDLSDKYFNPIISETECVDGKLISKKSKSVVGHQG